MTRTYAVSMRCYLFFAIILSTITLTAQVPKWEAAHGPYGSVCQDLVQTASGIFLLNDERNGVWRSTDSCAHWQLSSSGISGRTVYALARASDGSILAGTRFGIFRSSDEGSTWEAHNTGITSMNIKDIVVLSDGTVLATAWGGGIYRSTDEGKIWTESNSGVTQLSIYCLRSNASDHVFAGSFGSGVFRSTDKGMSWTALPLSGYVYDIGVRPDGVLLALSNNSGLFQSSDNGDTWVKSDQGLPSWSGQGFAARSSSEILFGVNVEGGMYRSLDGGSTWSAFNDGYSLTTTRGLSLRPNGDCLAMTHGDGVYRLPKDGSHWSPQNAGMQGTWIYALESVSDSVLLAGGYGGVWITRDQGASWSYTDAGVGSMRVADLLYTNQTVWVAGYAGSIRKSTDMGNHWSPVVTGSSSDRPSCLAMDGSGILFCGYEGDGIYSSTNDGDTWQAVSNGLTSLRVHAMCVDAAAVLYASTDDGVFTSTNKGATWSLASNGLQSMRCYTLAAADNYVYAGMPTGVYRSGDHGANWAQVGNGQLPSRAHHAISIDEDGVIYAGGAGSVWTSTDDGETWQNSAQGFPPGDVYDIAFTTQGQLFAATEGNGVYRLPAKSRESEITIATSPEGRAFTVDGESFSSPQTFVWEVGSKHEISTTTPQDGAPGIRYVWSAWSNGEELTHTWTVPEEQAYTITASFDTEYQLTMTAGPGGTVSPQTGWHASGAQVQLTAAPVAEYTFDHWEGTGQGAYSGPDNPTTITLQNPVRESAVFRQLTDIPTVRLHPETVVLHQNAPNPVRDVAVIPFSLPGAQPVTLVVTDVLGHVLMHLLEGEYFPAGKHQVVADVSELPAGVYFYRLATPDGVTTRAMVLQK